MSRVFLLIFPAKYWGSYPRFFLHLVSPINLGATVVTQPTDFYGGKLARFIDPQGNLWWLFELSEYDESDWFSEENTEETDAVWALEPDSDMTYIHDSLVEAMKKLNDFQ